MKAFSPCSPRALCASLLAVLPAAGFAGSPAPSPKAPVASVTTQPADDWQVTASAYGWLAGLEGTTGVKGFTSEVDVPFSGILDHLDMTASINLEAQKGRWGGWIDGMYLKVSAGGETPDPLLDIVNVSVTQVAAEAALFYRVWQGDRGSLDLYAGARYMSVKGDLSLSLSDEGVEQVSSNLSARLIDEILSGVKSKAAPVLEAKKAQLTSQLASQAAVLLQDLKAIGESHPGLINTIKQSERLQQALRDVASARIDEQVALVQNKVASVKACRPAALWPVLRKHWLTRLSRHCATTFPPPCPPPRTGSIPSSVCAATTTSPTASMAWPRRTSAASASALTLPGRPMARWATS